MAEPMRNEEYPSQEEIKALEKKPRGSRGKELKKRLVLTGAGLLSTFLALASNQRRAEASDLTPKQRQELLADIEKLQLKAIQIATLNALDGKPDFKSLTDLNDPSLAPVQKSIEAAIASTALFIEASKDDRLKGISDITAVVRGSQEVSEKTPEPTFTPEPPKEKGASVPVLVTAVGFGFLVQDGKVYAYDNTDMLKATGRTEFPSDLYVFIGDGGLIAAGLESGTVYAKGTLADGTFRWEGTGAVVTEPTIPEGVNREVFMAAYDVLPSGMKERASLPESDARYISFNKEKNGFVDKEGIVWRPDMSPKVDGIYTDVEAGWLTETDRKTITTKSKDGKEISLTFIMEMNTKKGVGLREYKNITFGKDFEVEIKEYINKFVGSEWDGKTIRIDWVSGIYEGFVPFSPTFIESGFRPDSKTAVTAMGYSNLGGELQARTWSLGQPEKKWDERHEKYWFGAALAQSIVWSMDKPANDDPANYLSVSKKDNSILGKGTENTAVALDLLTLSKNPPKK